MPCYTPWDAYLDPESHDYREARARVQAIADSTSHMINAYMQLHGIEPPGERVELKFDPTESKYKSFALDKLSTGMLHRLAQHCLCDGIGAVELLDAQSMWSTRDETGSIYVAIADDLQRAIRLGLPFGRYDRAAYAVHDWKSGS